MRDYCIGPDYDFMPSSRRHTTPDRTDIALGALALAKDVFGRVEKAASHNATSVFVFRLSGKSQGYIGHHACPFSTLWVERNVGKGHNIEPIYRLLFCGLRSRRLRVKGEHSHRLCTRDDGLGIFEFGSQNKTKIRYLNGLSADVPERCPVIQDREFIHCLNRSICL